MLSFLKLLIKDKDGSYNLRRLIIVLFSLVVIISWIGAQFFGFQVPQYIFESLVKLIDFSGQS